MKKLLPLLLLLQFQTSFGRVASDSVSTVPTASGNEVNVPNLGEYVTSIADNGVGLITSPLRWKGKDWAILGGTLATAGLLTLADNDINNFFGKWDSKFADKYGSTGRTMGKIPFITGGTSAVYLFSKITKNKKLENFALDNFQTQIFTGSITCIAKNMFGRARPFNNLGSGHWAGMMQDNDYQSFFSGHTSMAFSTATMIYLHSHKKLWVGLVSYAGATAIGVSRMQTHAHWASDVFLGAVTGWAVSTFVFNQNEKRRNVKKWSVRL